MASTGLDGFLQGLGQGFFGSDYLKDYTHASKTFVAGNYALAPRTKFLFHVYFNLNTVEIPALANIFDAGKTRTIGLMAKTVQLPNFQIDVETMNQYNRKRIVQKKITYEPAQITLHDDNSDLVRTMWYNYFSYYYKDPTQGYWSSSNSGAPSGSSTAGRPYNYNARDIYADQRSVNDWGYVGESYSDGSPATATKPPFFKDITIYGLNQHKYAAYTLINPLITQWQHDTYDYSQYSGTMQDQMTIKYETVKYYSGTIGTARPDPNVNGFADPTYYDQVKSPLARAGSSASILGTGGLVDSIGSIIEDLQSGNIGGAIKAVQTAGATYNQFKNVNIASAVKQEAIGLATSVILGPGAAAAKTAMNTLNNTSFSFPGVQTGTSVTPTVTYAATPTKAP
jgi:hypothetical protein